MNLVEHIKSLPGPVLIAGHANPDGDVISTAAALLNFINNQETDKAYFTYKGSFPSNLKWIIEEKYLADPEFLEYKSLIVVDCSGSSLRLGFTPKNVPTVVLDHHDTSFALEDTDTIKYITGPYPSTSSILYEAFGITDPIIYIGLFYDCFHRNENTLYASKVLSGLDITEELIKDYHNRLREKRSLESIDVIRSAYVFNLDVREDLLFTAVSYKCDPCFYFDILSFFSQYTDFLVLFNEQTGSITIRSFKDVIDVGMFCNKFGGGGTKVAGGCMVVDVDSYNHIVNVLLKELNTELVNEN